MYIVYICINTYIHTYIYISNYPFHQTEIKFSAHLPEPSNLYII